MGRHTKRVAAAAAVAALGAAGAATAAVAGHDGGTVRTVTVTMREFKLTPSTTKVAAGKVTFVAVNKGRFPHALAISGPDAKARTALVKPGKSARFTVKLEDNASYRIWCPVSNHAALGMRLNLKIGDRSGASGSTTPTPAPSTTTTTTPYDGGGVGVY